jgi:predicted RNase H-like HicB family nuclease
MKKYAVIYETGRRGGYSAYAPDLPGCVAASATLQECRSLMKQAIEFHVAGMRLHGEQIPEPSSVAEALEVDAA